MREDKQQLLIREARLEDAEAITAIYNWYIANSSCTFEEQTLDAAQMRERMAAADGSSPWIVLEQGSIVRGYAYAAVFKARTAYNRSREVTVYLHRDAYRRGYGRTLYQHLIDELQKKPIHSLIAIIALPNESSVALHEGLGFEKAGHLREVGHKFGKYVDVGYWQLLL